MSCTEGNKKGRAVRNSNCNGIDMADDARERMDHETSCAHSSRCRKIYCG